MKWMSAFLILAAALVSAEEANWYSLHKEGDKNTLVLYPVPGVEKNVEALKSSLAARGNSVDKTVDLTHFEKEGKVLEGTNSLVLDRVNKIAYASLSSRTQRPVVDAFCKELGYTPVTFVGVDEKGDEIDHTSVIMCVGTRFAVLCQECIATPFEAQKVLRSLIRSGKKILFITREQMKGIQGHILEVQTEGGEIKIVLSEKAAESFTKKQLAQLKKFGTVVQADRMTETTQS